MSTRRQPSTTSLSKYARTNSPAVANRSLDFCNAFWGLGDGGVDVLFARMRGASRTMDELRNFWKERSAIEEEYAKRLTKLVKITLGKDEVGELRNSLDTIRLETDKQAGYHLQLAQQIRTDLEGQTAAFSAKQTHHKKMYQSVIEKEFRAKQSQESHVNKAREKYEADCLRINSYTAQSTLVQGKDYEKIQLKLERAQQTVQANERDFANFAKALQETVQQWEHNWKEFCDGCQDLEEDRLEFMKDNMWAYTNAVSTVCVHDDESCEKMRLALEQMEPEKDMENFVRDYGTGNLIPDPPAFVNYANADTPSSSSSRPTTRPAQFTRSSQRTHRTAPQPPSEQEPLTNAAGIGAGSSRQPDSSLHRAGTHSRGPSRGQVNGTSVNGIPSSSQPVSRRPTQSTKITHDPAAEPIDPTASTFIKVGANAYPVDLSNDPQQGPSRSGGGGSSSTQTGQSIVDPLAKQLEDLRGGASSGSGSVRRSGTWKPTEPRAGQSSSRQGTSESAAGPSSLSLPSSSAQASGSRDYNTSADMVVGTHPSRPSSPNPPTASFMHGPPKVSPTSDVENILNQYQQSFPGERKMISRPNSRQDSAPPNQGPGSSGSHSHNLSQGQNLARPVSREGHPGIGAHGRSSPQPISRTASPVGVNKPNINPAHRGPAPGDGYTQGSAARAVSPNRVGITLDPNGTVVEDAMLERFNRQQRQPQGQQYNAPPQRRASYINNGVVAPPPVQQPGYGFPPPTPGAYANQPYMNPAGPQRPVYNPAQAPYQIPPTQQQQQQLPVYPNQSAVYGGMEGVLQRGPSTRRPYNPQQMAAPPSQLPPPQQPGYGGAYRTPSPMRTPSPLPPQIPPTGQTTEEGVGILFYVKALYDYNATIEEEFDFQAGDIIAVTATPEDGWWSGELLDEARRQPGRHVFPSNFVCLF